VPPEICAAPLGVASPVVAAKKKFRGKEKWRLADSTTSRRELLPVGERFSSGLCDSVNFAGRPAS